MKARGGLGIAALLIVSTAWIIDGQSGSPREDAYRHNNLGIAHLERYDFQAAADAFRQALTIEPGLTIARLNLAIARLYDGQHDAAAVDAKAAAAAMPLSPHGHYVSGLIARAGNRTPDAIAAFQRALEIDPDDVGSRIQLAQIHTQNAGTTKPRRSSMPRCPGNRSMRRPPTVWQLRSCAEANARLEKRRWRAFRRCATIPRP